MCEKCGKDYACMCYNPILNMKLDRKDLYELGRKTSYFKWINFPVEVTAEIEVRGKEANKVMADEVIENSGPAIDFALKNIREHIYDLMERMTAKFQEYLDKKIERFGGLEDIFNLGKEEIDRSYKICETRKCNGCGKPLLLKNEWMEDGCPCNSPKGCNKQEKVCDCPIDVLMTSGCKCGGK